MNQPCDMCHTSQEIAYAGEYILCSPCFRKLDKYRKAVSEVKDLWQSVKSLRNKR